jgi:hypothetical protein
VLRVLPRLEMIEKHLFVDRPEVVEGWHSKSGPYGRRTLVFRQAIEGSLGQLAQHQGGESCALPKNYSNQPFLRSPKKCLWSRVGNYLAPDASRSYRSHTRETVIAEFKELPGRNHMSSKARPWLGVVVRLPFPQRVNASKLYASEA